jgi:hypothetical protein
VGSAEMVEPVFHLRYLMAYCLRKDSWSVMKCDLCKLDDRLEAAQLCAVCSEALARVVWAQLRIEAEKAVEAVGMHAQTTGIDVDDYRKAFGG